MASIAATEQVVRQLNSRLNALTHSYDGYRDAMAKGQARQEDRMAGIEGRLDGMLQFHVVVENRLSKLETEEEVPMNLENRVTVLEEFLQPIREDDLIPYLHGKVRVLLKRMKHIESEQGTILEAFEQGPNRMRICRKYGVNEYGRVYNLQSGAEIPEDEPVILFRAKDVHLPMVLMEYVEKCADTAHAKFVQQSVAEVMAWQANNQDVVREPDTDLSDYDSGPESDDADDAMGQARIVGPTDDLVARRGPSLMERIGRLERVVLGDG